MLWLWPSRSHLKGSADLGKRSSTKRNGPFRPLSSRGRQNGRLHSHCGAIRTNLKRRLLRMGIRVRGSRRRNTCGARARSPQYFLPVPLALPRLTAIKSRKERARAASDVKISQARFPGEIRSKKQLPQRRERELLFSSACPPLESRTQDGTLTRSFPHSSGGRRSSSLSRRPNGMSFMHFEIGKWAAEFQAGFERARSSPGRPTARPTSLMDS